MNINSKNLERNIHRTIFKGTNCKLDGLYGNKLRWNKMELERIVNGMNCKEMKFNWDEL